MPPPLSILSFCGKGKLAGCALPTEKQHIKNLGEKHNVGVVFSLLQEENAPPLDYFEGTGVDSEIIEWRDFGVPSLEDIKKMVEQAKQYIEEKGKVVLVHCFAGMGRTGTALACLLCFLEGTKPEEAIFKVREKCSGAIENLEQEQFVFHFYNRIHPEEK